MIATSIMGQPERCGRAEDIQYSVQGASPAFPSEVNQERVRHCMYILRALFVGSICLCDVIFAQQQQVVSIVSRPAELTTQQSTAGIGLPSAVPADRPLIGLALEGGGALGLAHIGVLEWFEENHIPVDRIAGTSMGALVGAMYASGQSITDVKKLVTSNEFNDMFALRPSYSRLSFRRRQDRSELPQAISLGLKGGKISFGNALVSDDRLDTFLTDEFVSSNSANLDFDQLPTAFRAVATDLTTLKPKVFRSGSLPFAVRSSIAIPGVFQPVRLDGHVFVDGAIVDNLPVDVLRDDLGAQVLIAVHLTDAAFATNDAASLVGVFARAYQAGTARNEDISRSQANIVLLPDVAKFTSTEYDKSVMLIAAGYSAAEAQRSTLSKYALNDADWKLYLEDRASRRRTRPGFIHNVIVEDETSHTASLVKTANRELADKPFEEERTDRFVTELRSNGGATAFYETFREPASESSTSPAHLQDDGLKIHLRPNWDGPPYLLLGADVVAMTGNVTSSIFDIRFVDQNLGGYGSELRSTIRLGYLTHIDTEYYKPLTSNGFFIQPHLTLDRDPVYLWVNQKRVSERQLQRAGGSLDAGWTVNPRLQVALTYADNQVRWTLIDGTDDSPNQHLSGTAQQGGVHFSYSDAASAIASPYGIHVDAFLGALFHTGASPNTPMANIRIRQSWTIAEHNTVSLSGDANTYFRANVADPFRFTLGGPLRLYASSVDEYRGTDDAIGRLVYLRKIAMLPTGIGEGVYLTGGYEAGNVWSPEAHSILRQDGFGGLLLSTPLGALTLGGAIGDAGHRKIFFTFGRLF
jgi:NTE family protein